MTPEYVDIAAVLAGNDTGPKTSAGGRRSDGVPLLYSTAVNVLLGAPEAGKTLVAGGMAADELYTGGNVLWMDLDHNGARALIARLRQFGVSPEVLTDPTRFRLAIPDDADAVTAIVTDVTGQTWTPSLVVVDSIGELLPMFGANSNDADDYTRVHRAVLTRMSTAGAAVLGIDHEAKGNDSRSYGATGSAAKKRAVDGALIRVTNITPFAPGLGGEAQLSIVKDRHGALRALSNGREPVIATFNIRAIPGGMAYRFTVPATSSATPDDIEILDTLTPPPKSVTDVKARLSWGSTRATDALREWREKRSSTPPEFDPPRNDPRNAPENEGGTR